MWNIGWAPKNASKWQMGFNWAFKVLTIALDWKCNWDGEDNQAHLILTEKHVEK